MRHPRVKRDQMVVGRPWHGKIRLALVLAARVNLLDSVPLGVRKEACAKKEKG
jgi:hypothetical protein